MRQRNWLVASLALLCTLALMMTAAVAQPKRGGTLRVVSVVHGIAHNGFGSSV
jgi:hypothetical protein